MSKVRKVKKVRLNLLPACIGMFFAMLPVAAQAQQSGVSVALSDNLIVLEQRSRSGTIELVNLASDPTEFRISILGVTDSEVDGSDLIRWAPQRALAPANRTLPFRVSARPPGDLPAGEYLIRVGVTAEVQAPPPIPRDDDDTEEPEAAIAVVVPIVPTLPVTVYYRHGIETPMVDAKPLVETPDDEKFIGYFPVVKQQPNYSFVGTVQVIEKTTGTLINRGRLHLRQSTEQSNVRMPRGEQNMIENGVYCLQIWDHWPGEGAPTKEVCSG
ncbi:hypothetical protein LG288_11095 [Idiomarina seosinensis]|uniref:hypothetical protein n=1 Tax=Idiomarina seosinensis TaxID=281739 RepID=UPI00384C4F08